MITASAMLQGRSSSEAAILVTSVIATNTATGNSSVTRTETALGREAIENLRNDCSVWLGDTERPQGPRKPGELADDIVRMLMTHDISSQAVRRWVREQISIWLKELVSESKSDE